MLLHILGAFAAFGIAAALLLGAANLGLVYYTKQVEIPLMAAETFVSYFDRAVPAAVFILSSLSTIWLFSLLISLYHQYREDVRPSAVLRNKTGLLYHLSRLL